MQVEAKQISRALDVDLRRKLELQRAKTKPWFGVFRVCLFSFILGMDLGIEIIRRKGHPADGRNNTRDKL